MSEKTKEEQQGRILPRKDFELQSFKLNKGKGIVIKHYIRELDWIQESNCSDSPHPDLIEVMNELRPYMADRLGLTEGWDFARVNTNGDLDYSQKARNGYDAVVSRMNVNGLTFKGDTNSDKFGVSITGSFKTPKEGSVGCSVPKITFKSDKLGIEEEVREICERITDEVYNYLILKKKEQANVEDQAKGFDNNGGVQTSILDTDVNGAEQVEPRKGKAQQVLEKYQEINEQGKTDASKDEG